MTIIRIGLDTSKHVFQIHGVDENEKPVLRRQLRRSEVEKFFAKLAPTRIGIGNSLPSWRRRESASRRAAPRITGRGCCAAWGTRCC